MTIEIIADSVVKMGGFVTGALTLIGVFFAVFKLLENEKKQDQLHDESLEEREVFVKGLRACLQCVIRLGGNGSCQAALDELDQKLIELAHKRGRKHDS